jgi:aminotransferase
VIQLFQPELGTEELEAVRRVLDSTWLGQGVECDALEKELAAFWGVEKLLLLDSCTSALYMAAEICGFVAGLEVIVPTIHFPAAVGAVERAGANVIYADVDTHSMTLLPEEIERLQTWRTKGVMLLHYGGQPYPRMQEILDLCDKYGLWLIEDAAGCPASEWQGKAVGTIGDVGCWSFDAMKIMVTGGDGGAIWFKDEDGYRRAKILRNMGLKKLSGFEAAQKNDANWWENRIVRLWDKAWPNDIGAAIGREQLRKLRNFVGCRREIWRTYQQMLASVGDLILPPEPVDKSMWSTWRDWQVDTERADA